MRNFSWDIVSEEEGSRTESAIVPGGWLFKVTLYNPDNGPAAVSITFVPKEK